MGSPVDSGCNFVHCISTRGLAGEIGGSIWTRTRVVRRREIYSLLQLPLCHTPKCKGWAIASGFTSITWRCLRTTGTYGFVAHKSDGLDFHHDYTLRAISSTHRAIHLAQQPAGSGYGTARPIPVTLEIELRCDRLSGHYKRGD